MLRIIHALGLLLAAQCLLLGTQNDPSSEPGVPLKKAFGPDHRSCRKLKGLANHSDGVIGGTVVTDPNEFPFLAWLGDNDGSMESQFCGGTLISDRTVLTAGHCLYNDNDKNAQLLVRLKVADMVAMMGVTRSVDNWRRHPEFNPMNLHNDLTLLLLNESVPASLVEPLRLSDGTKSFEQSGEKMIVGWGSTDEECHVYDTLLRKSAVPFGEIFGRTCSSPGSKQLRAQEDFDPNSQCCAGDYDGNMHYPGCGDSGGPLLAQDGGRWAQVGMVSYSYGVPYPDVFTRVSNFRDWIEKATEALLHEGKNPTVNRMEKQRHV
uniref:Peptidase S1 domain-containing protein n=1 Tax=Alexandrium catenella TaxID=2925 RepID=A0A7S1WR80_ALECA|mmetsp:Transcript_8394/g.22786  ORF Transcript_8394/g.22786 Transcript_8394/m.22786 type:complete len:320 (+) Transcript_8394:67-1026(+)